MSSLFIILAIGLVTYLSRLSFIALFATRGVPRWLETPLKYVAPAILAALVAPAVFAPEGPIDVTGGNPRFFAGLVAVAVAWQTRSVVWTIAAGMVALWLLQAIL